MNAFVVFIHLRIGNKQPIFFSVTENIRVERLFFIQQNNFIGNIARRAKSSNICIRPEHVVRIVQHAQRSSFYTLDDSAFYGQPKRIASVLPAFNRQPAATVSARPFYFAIGLNVMPYVIVKKQISAFSAFAQGITRIDKIFRVNSVIRRQISPRACNAAA